MKLTYDPRQNIAYLRLHAKTTEVETVHVTMRSTSIWLPTARCTVSNCSTRMLNYPAKTPASWCYRMKSPASGLP